MLLEFRPSLVQEVASVAVNRSQLRCPGSLVAGLLLYLLRQLLRTKKNAKEISLSTEGA